MNTLIKDVFETILKKLNLVDVKNLSLTNKYLSEITNNHMFENYFYYDNVEINQKRIKNIILRDDRNIKKFASANKICIYNRYEGNITWLPETLTVLGGRNVPLCAAKLKYNIPNNVIILSIQQFNEHIKLPDNLLELNIFDLYYNKLIGGFPNTIKTLRIHSLVDDYDFDLPKNITKLTLNCNQKKDFPETITHLKIRCNPVIRQIPNSVTHLTFGISYNQELKYSLPDNLTHLEFGEMFNQDLKHKLPVSLIKLKLCSQYSYTLDPKELVKYPHFNLINLQYFDLCIRSNRVKNICSSVTSLYIRPDEHNTKIILNFTNNTKKILFDSNCNNIIKEYPKNLELLTFGYYYKRKFSTRLPDSLEYLNLGHCFNKSITGILPPNLKHIIFSDCFNCDIKNALPESLIYIIFGFSFNQKIIGNIPKKCQYLHFGKKFDQDIIDIPDSVLKLYLGIKFVGRENEVKLSVQQLIINGKYIIR